MEYSHFSIHTVGDGIHAAIHKEGGAAYSNSGILDLGETTLVFDTFDMAAAAKELLTAAEDLTGRPPVWVVNSHKHGDHWGGNQVFAGQAVILATRQTRSGMLGWGEEITRLSANPGEIEKRISQLEEKIQQEKDELRKAALERNLARNRFLLKDLPGFRFTPPSMTFTGSLSVLGTKRNAELTTVTGAHTPEECYLTIPGTKIIFTGDLAFFGCPPFIAQDASLDGWLNALDKFSASDMECFVPGHGPLGGHKELDLQKDYLVYMRDLVMDAIANSLSLEEILQIPEPCQFKEWGLFPQRHDNNLRSLHFQMQKKIKGG